MATDIGVFAFFRVEASLVELQRPPRNNVTNAFSDICRNPEIQNFIYTYELYEDTDFLKCVSAFVKFVSANNLFAKCLLTVIMFHHGEIIGTYLCIIKLIFDYKSRCRYGSG